MENGLEQEGLYTHNNKFVIEFKDLSYSVNEKKGRKTVEVPILKDISGRFESGHLIALLGPSGAGKTSFLNVLSGLRKSGVRGSIMVNGYNRRDMDGFRKLSCYIPQEFAMLPLLTTEETLLNAADLKFGKNIGKLKKTAMVNEILQILGLQKAKDTRVGNLSGGEKRRLCIGVELLVNPPFMFFDEPTSGLDSSSTVQVVSHLKSLAKDGRIIVCSIHQPSSRVFEMFDDVYLLAEGQCIYTGPIRDMTTVLKEEGIVCPIYYNRSDFAIEIACGERGNKEKLIAKFRNSEPINEPGAKLETDALLLRNISNREEKETAITIPTEKSYLYPVSTLLQIIILTKRAVLCNFRDLYITKVRIAFHLLFGIFLGILCYDIGNEAAKISSNAGFLFFVALFIFFVSPCLTLLVFPLEAPVFLREHQNNWYSVGAYYFSKILADLPLQIFCQTIFLLGGYFLSDQPNYDMRLLKFWGVCMLLGLCGQSIGFVIGVAFSAQMGLFMIMCINLPLALFSGFFVRINDISATFQWMIHVSYFRYALEGILISIYGENRPKLECSDIYCHFKNPYSVLEEFNFTHPDYGYNIALLVIWVFILQVLFYCVLKWRVRSH